MLRNVIVGMARLRLRSRRKACSMLASIVLVWACTNAVQELQPTTGPEGAKRIFVIGHGWHSGIIIQKTDIPDHVIPESRDFPAADYLEFGWGDWDYYQHPDPGIALAVKAAFWSTRSVLYVGGIAGTVEDYFRGSEVYRISMSDEAFARLIEFISETFLRSKAGAPAEARPGLSPESRFYPAKGRFHILRTCNTWIAEGLRSAGLPVAPSCAITAGSLIHQVKPLAAPKP